MVQIKNSFIYILFALVFVLVFSGKEEDAESVHLISSTLPDETDHWTDSLLNRMTIDEKIGQLFMVPVYPQQGIPDRDRVKGLINDYKVGGLIFFKSGPVQQAKLTNYFQSVTKTPLMIAGDYEWGLSMRMDSTVDYPRQMMLGAIQNDLLIYEFGKEIAKQCKRIGIHINFAPVIDVNNNASNPVINYRSFGEDKENVAKKGMAYMIGLQDNHIVASGKHFPGHGDTDTDSHLDLPVINHSFQRLDEIELYPFKRLIYAGLTSVMIAHLHIPALDSAPNMPSSLSKKIITDLLKKKMKFDGLVFTDALGMQGVAKHFQPGDVEVKAIMAGVDVLLMPENVPVAFMKIKTALANGDITEEDIDEKCLKILKIKKWLGLNQYKAIELKNLYKDLNSPEAEQLKMKLIESSLTLVVNKDRIIPFRNLDKESIATVSIGNGNVNNFQKTLELYDDIQNFSIVKTSEEKSFNILSEKLKEFDKVIVSIHQMNNTAPDFGINQNTVHFIQKLSKETKVIVVIFGNAYALKNLKEPENLFAVLVSYNDWSETRELSAQLLFGGVSARGKLPISAGDLFPAGKGDYFIQNRLNYSSAYTLHLNNDTIQKIDSVIWDAIKQEATPGATILAARNNIVFFHKSYGYHTYNETRRTKNTDIYDLASITKIGSTVLILMKLVEENKIDLSQTISLYVPELVGTDKENITILEILIHQSGFIPWIPFYMETFKDKTNKVLDYNIYSKTKTEVHSIKVAEKLYISKAYTDTIYKKIYESKLLPDKKYKYSDLGFILLHKIIESVTGESQETYSKRNYYEKLGANTLGYLPLMKHKQEEIVPTEQDDSYRKQLIQGYVHDYAAAMTGGVNGHAGLFSNANDLAKLLQMYLNGGIYGGERYLKSSTIKQFTSCLLCNDENRRALGFDKPLRPTGGPSSQYASDQSFGHSGFTGVLVWVDPKYKFIYVFLSNRVNPTSENNKLLKMNVRTKVQDLFYKSFPDLDTVKVLTNKVSGSL
jgi:beta-glucosidase-like glycosyl hydrolase/CubicO group peptidase (beta-lactamase class C family)